MFVGTSCLVTQTIPFSVFSRNISLYLCNEESGLTNFFFTFTFYYFCLFLWNETAKAHIASGTGISNIYQFHYSHHFVLWTTLTALMGFCRFRHKMIHNKVAVHKQNDQLLSIWWSTNLKNPTWTGNQSKRQKTLIWPAVQGSKERTSITPATSIWSLFTLATALHIKWLTELTIKCLKW